MTSHKETPQHKAGHRPTPRSLNKTATSRRHAATARNQPAQNKARKGRWEDDERKERRRHAEGERSWSTRKKTDESDFQFYRLLELINHRYTVYWLSTTLIWKGRNNSTVSSGPSCTQLTSAAGAPAGFLRYGRRLKPHLKYLSSLFFFSFLISSYFYVHNWLCHKRSQRHLQERFWGHVIISIFGWSHIWKMFGFFFHRLLRNQFFFCSTFFWISRNKKKSAFWFLSEFKFIFTHRIFRIVIITPTLMSEIRHFSQILDFFHRTYFSNILLLFLCLILWLFCLMTWNSEVLFPFFIDLFIIFGGQISIYKFKEKK